MIVHSGGTILLTGLHAGAQTLVAKRLITMAVGFYINYVKPTGTEVFDENTVDASRSLHSDCF